MYRNLAVQLIKNEQIKTTEAKAKEIKPVVDLTNSILLLIPPSLTFFVVLPLALKKLDFIYSIFISIIATVLVYWLYIALLSRLGIRL